jgi:hypothetical protein
VPPPGGAGPGFLRGNANGSSLEQGVDVSDAIYVLNYLFLGGAAPQG